MKSELNMVNRAQEIVNRRIIEELGVPVPSQ
jgi:hypothetical protein